MAKPLVLMGKPRFAGELGGLETRGIEPPSAHCERAVLPLNDVPFTDYLNLSDAVNNCKFQPEMNEIGTQY